MTFYSVLSKHYDTLFPLNKKTITFIKEEVPMSGTIIDIAAGTGNHALALAKEGYSLIATDLDENMVRIMQEKASNKKVAINVLKIAMEQTNKIEIKHPDAVLCLGNSLVHLKSLEKIKLFLLDVYDLLSENGTVIVQTVNYDRVLHEQITTLPILKRDSVSFIRTYSYSNGNVRFKGVLQVQDERFESEVDLFPITSEQVCCLLQEVGFKTINIYGSYERTPFEKNSLPMIVVASKAQAPCSQELSHDDSSQSL